jgi:hypothetical protein
MASFFDAKAVKYRVVFSAKEHSLADDKSTSHMPRQYLPFAYGGIHNERYGREDGSQR